VVDPEAMVRFDDRPRAVVIVLVCSAENFGSGSLEDDGEREGRWMLELGDKASKFRYEHSHASSWA
jgi:hypothetical protein